MKIKLTEEQFIRLMEANGVSAPSFDGGDIKEFPSSEVGTVSNVINSDGDLEYGKPTTTDDFSDSLTIQNYWAATRTGARLSR